jgi:hypothetical protein
MRPSIRIWRSHRDWRWTVGNGRSVIREGRAPTVVEARGQAQRAAAQEANTVVSDDGMTILKGREATP